MQKNEMTKQERILNARRKGWNYLKEYFCVDFKTYCRFLDDLHSGKPRPAIWMIV